MHYSDAFLGRAYLQLQEYLKMPFHQYYSQILYHIMDVLGDKLLKVYKSHFRGTVRKLLTEYVPRFEQYIASGEIKREPQNQEKFYELPADPACKGPACMDCQKCYKLKHDSGIYQAS